MPTAPHDLVNFTKQYKGDLEEIYLDLKNWRKFRTAHPLTWQRVRFDKNGREQVPKVRGIYVFTLEFTPSALPAHGYILYVGITGQASAATLNSRYRQYELERDKEKGRPRVLYMLRNWAGDLHFNYVPIPDTKVDLAAIETSFLNSVIPPVNWADFSAEVTRTRKAKL